MQRRILLSIFGLIGIIAGLVYSVNRLIVQQSFRAYNAAHVSAHVELIPSILRLHYANYDSWDGVEFELVQLTVLAGTQVTIVDAAGIVVASTGSDTIGKPESGGSPYSNRFEIDGPDGDIVGTALVRIVPSTQVVDRTLSQNLNQGLLISLTAAVLVGMFIAGVLARSISQPIKNIEAAAKKLAAGQYNIQIPPLRSNDEVAALANTFNHMSGRIQETEEVRSRLIADVSHDLRTPLTVLKGYVEGLSSGQISDRGTAIQLFNRMEREIDYLQGLVEALSTSAKWERHQLQPKRNPIDLHQLVNQTIDRLQPIAAKKEAQVLNDIPTEWPKISLDKSMMDQVFYNLLLNGLTHNESGITIRVSGKTAPNHTLLSVADNGKGIPKADQSRIFERLVRLDNERGRSSGGMGMGLSIVKNIVNAHNGEIWVEKNGEKGANFHIKLPTPPL